MDEHALRRYAGDRGFWADYFGARFAPGGHYPEATHLALSFPVDGEYGLLFEMWGMDLFSLSLRHPGTAVPVSLATDDGAHPMPHGLRWAELDLIGRCAAWDAPDLPHPGLAVALLCRFTPLATGDDADVALPLLEAALRHVASAADPYGVFGTAPGAGLPDRDVRTYMESCDHRDDFFWTESPDVGWYPDCLVQTPGDHRPLYSHRTPSNENFPFAGLRACTERARRRLAAAPDPRWLTPEVLRPLGEIVETGDLGQAHSLLTALRAAGCDNLGVLHALAEPLVPARACWVIETLAGAEPGSLIRRHFGPATWHPRPSHTLEFSGDPGELARLNGAMHGRGLGSADIGRYDGRDFTLEIRLRGDLDEAIGRLAELFEEDGFPPPPGVTLRTPPYGSLPWPRRRAPGQGTGEAG